MRSADSNPRGEMGLFDHLAELRKRLAYSLLALSTATLLSYSYAGRFFAFLTEPYFRAFSREGAELADLIGTGPAEAFLLKIKVSIFAGIILSSPFLFYQTWLFISPGLYRQEKRWILPFLFSSTLLFLSGAAFCYYAVLPLAFDFFNAEYASIGIVPAVKISEYLGLVIGLLLAFGAVFEVPILAFFLAQLGIIDDKMLLSWMRPALVAIFIISAVITPPDVVSQLLLAGPLILLYGVSIPIAKYAHRPREFFNPEELAG